VEAIRNSEARFVLEIEKGYAAKLAEGKPFAVKVLYDDSDRKAAGSIGILMDAIQSFNHSVVLERLAQLNISPDVLEPLRVEQVTIPQDRKSGNPMLMMMLPMMVAIMIAVGGIPAATDLVAGEKERSTFEPLLTTKPGRMSILFGKYLTVTLFSFISVIAQFAGMAVGIIMTPGYLSMGGTPAQVGNFSIPPVALMLTLFVTLALGMVFAGLQLAISTYARSFKEAQTYLSFLIFVALIPAYATMLLEPGDLKTYMFAVPLLNAIAALKMVLGGIIDNSNLFLAFATSIVYVAISLVFSAKLFNRENVLFRS
jgi:sodium transport system permease protein